MRSITNKIYDQMVAEPLDRVFINWDDARDNGMPILNAINHLISRELYRLQRQAYAEVLYRLVFSTWLIKEERDFMERLYGFCRVDPAHHPEVIDLLDKSGQLS